GDTAVDAITRDGDTQDYILNNAVSNIVADNFSVLVKKYGGKVVSNVETTAKANGVVKHGDAAGSGIMKSVESINFYITPHGQAIPSTAYRAIGGKSNIGEALEGTISSRNPIYITFDNIIDIPPSKIKNLLQLPHAPTHVVEFDTFQLIDDITIPTGRWNTTNILEPITKTFPEWGTGGGTQAVTHLPIKIKKINKLK
ncbi:MAG: hypothetical protein JRJ44_05445, partial [Deltaproteobacteria bacterium]|nr:hypothetical protein [Deltaproteobacteria bacterium]